MAKHEDGLTAPAGPKKLGPRQGGLSARGIKDDGDLAMFRAAVRMSPMPMCLSDPRQHDNPVVFVNRAFEDMTGYREGEILGRNCRFLQGPDTDRSVVEEISRSIRAKVDVSVELYNYRKDGSGFWNALYLSPVLGDTDDPLYFFASQIDVTRRREAEAMVRQMQGSRAVDRAVEVASGPGTPAPVHDSKVVLQRVLLDTRSGDTDGCLVFGRDGLTGVLVHLSSQHGTAAGRWHLERGFGLLDGQAPAPFIDLDVAKRWVERQLDPTRTSPVADTNLLSWPHKPTHS